MVSIAHIYQRTMADQARLHSLPQDILAIDSTDLSQALHQAARLVRDAMDAHTVAIMLYDDALDALQVKGLAGIEVDDQGATREADIGGAALDVYRTGNPHFARYADANTYQDDGDGTSHDQATLILPLMVADVRQGVVEIVLDQVELSKPHTVAELKTAASVIGVLVYHIERAEHLVRDTAQQARSTLIEEIASTLNHDMRNMMAPISGRLDLIRRQATREGHEKYVRHAEEATTATRRMQAALQNLVDVARLEQGKLPLARGDVDLPALVRDVVAAVSNPITTAQIDVEDDVHVSGDPERIRQTLEYLIVNAFRYSPEDQPVTITVGRLEEDGSEWAMVSVCDQGACIPPELLPLIWTHWITGRSSNNFNLGLYLAYGVAKAHGGTLRVQSDEASGTTWTLLLPAAS